MYHDDSNRSSQGPLTRRSIPSNSSRSYQQNQSPSSTYGNGYNSQQQGTGMRRRPDNGSALTANNRGRHFNPLDRVVKQNDLIIGQNDIIIKLLIEIRNRLPALSDNAQPAASEHQVRESLAAHEESLFEVSDENGAPEEAAEVNSEALDQQEEDNFNV
ncbi:MAG: hypothetical protein FWE57_07955 [Chitinispirillia bacterium]|nr:hypothetical protein [Chitinispirillia bacterium]